MTERSGVEWPMPIRTYLFDSLISRHIREGGDAVINLAAGLDARPYRMELPSSLRWVEVDLPEILDEKEEVLAAETPRCSLRRVRLDLADRQARRALFAELGAGSGNALVITEGLLVYLGAEQVAALAADLAPPAAFRRWVLDLVSPGLRRRLMQQFGDRLEEARAPFRFGPEEGPGFFAAYGWRPIEVRSMLKTAAAKGRLAWWMRLLASLPESTGKQGSRPWGGVCLLEKTGVP